MITLAPIAKNIQDTLRQKVIMLNRGQGGRVYKDADTGNWTNTSINSVVTDAEKGLAENYMFARSPWLRMTSFMPKKGTENQPVILMGGEYNEFGRLRTGFQDSKAGIGAIPIVETDPTTFLEYDGIYNINLDDEFPFRPMPGVKDISIGYKGGGMKLGATRSGEINWACWTWEELDRLTPHFLSPGKTVLLEWGWTGVGTLQDVVLLDIFENEPQGLRMIFNTDKIDNLNTRITKHIQDQNGHYDAILGIIQNFTWSVNETGGFDCTTNLISPGVTLMQVKGKQEKWKNFDSLPLLHEQTDNVTKEEQSQQLVDIAPYITFREYMSDFGSQIFHTFNHDDEGGTFKKEFPAFQVDTFNLPGWDSKEEKTVLRSYIHKIGRIGAYQFVSWGWIEDNVLSRFFGKIGDPANNKDGGNKRIISEFRSIEQVVNDHGQFLIDKGGEPVVQSTRFRNSKYLMTLNSSKWIIPNPGDPFWGRVEKSRPDIKLNGDLWKGTEGPTGGPWIQDTFFPYNLNKEAMEKGVVKKTYDNVDHMDIRSIIFNVEYLSKMSKKGNDVKSAVLSIWDDFAREYGGVYKFKLEYDDNTKRMMVREEGYTQIRVQKLLEKKAESKREAVEQYPNVFEFPIMEDGSIVKSQTINAKLPSRMQVSAMYGARGGTRNKNDKVTENMSYDENVGNAWGELSTVIKDPSTGEDDKDTRLTDLLTGALDYPSKANRGFGLMSADITKPLHIGTIKTKEEEIPGENGEITTVQQPQASQDPGEGTQIQLSILNDINESQKEYIQYLKKIDLDEEKKKNKDFSIKDLEMQIKAFNSAMTVFDARKKSDGVEPMMNKWLYEAGHPEEFSYGKRKKEGKEQHLNEADEIIDATESWEGEGLLGMVEEYQASLGNALLKKDWENEVEYFQSFEWGVEDTSAFLVFKQTIRHELIKLLRGNLYGVLANIDPLIPIEFEMVIDGTGGLFPGNSFHSSYLSNVYKLNSIFQMVGVDHTVDSSGWFTTIRGQIRAKTKLPPKKQFETEEAETSAIAEAVSAQDSFIKERETELKASDAENQKKIDLSNAIAGNTKAEWPPEHPKPGEIAKELFDGAQGYGTKEENILNALKDTGGFRHNLDMVNDEYRQTYSGQYSSVSEMIREEFSGRELICAQLVHGETPGGRPQGNGQGFKKGDAWGDNAHGAQGDWIKGLQYTSNPHKGPAGIPK